MRELFDIPLIHLVILFLASFRLTHLIVFDKIATFIRDPFITVTHQTGPDGQPMLHTEIKADKGWRYWIGSLLSCYWCVGVWASLVVVILYWLVPYSYPLLLILAIAGVASFIESKVKA